MVRRTVEMEELLAAFDRAEQRALARAKIRLMQRKVGVNDADERDVRKMQPLRDHLRADKDVGLARAKIAEHFPVIVLALHRVSVHAFDARVRKKLGECLFNFLRARAGKTNPGIFAFLVRANLRNFFNMTANVTGKFLFLPVKRECEAAIRTIANVTALRTL